MGRHTKAATCAIRNIQYIIDPSMSEKLALTAVKSTAARVPRLDAAEQRIVTSKTAIQATSLIDQSGISSAETSERVA